MRQKDQRALAWLVSIVVFFPLWIGVMYAADACFAVIESSGRFTLPPWLKGGLFFATIPAVIIPVSMLTARWMDRRSPLERSGSAAWDRQGNHSAAHRR